MKRSEALVIIRRAGYLNNFKTMIEIMASCRISYSVARSEFNKGFELKEVEEINFNNRFSSEVLSNE
jgi:hypothetical protein